LKKAERGDPEAMWKLGVKYSYGTLGFKKDDKLALKWYTKCHEAGNVKGTALMGYYMYKGKGGARKNCPEGIVYLGIAAAQGSNFAAYHLVMAWADGLHGMGVNKDEAIRWLETASGKCLHMHLAQEAKQKAQQKLNMLKAS
jgi:TPR repeat protein